VLLIPLAAAFISLAVFDLGRWLTTTLDPYIPSCRLIPLLAAISIIFFIYLGHYEWNLYYATVNHDGLVTSRIGRFLNTFPPEVTACDISGPYNLKIYELEFLAGAKNGASRTVKRSKAHT
jgi:hypothetical protein